MYKKIVNIIITICAIKFDYRTKRPFQYLCVFCWITYIVDTRIKTRANNIVSNFYNLLEANGLLFAEYHLLVRI